MKKLKNKYLDTYKFNYLISISIEMSKQYINPNNLHQYSIELAKKIIADDFKPNWIIAIWRGGCPIGMYVQGLLKHFGCNADHIAIRTSSYDSVGVAALPRVHGLEYVVKNMQCTDKVLIVDDVFDSGRSIKAVVTKMQRKLRANYPTDVRIATLYYKPENNKTDIVPNYWYEKTDKWLVFPHEFEDLTKSEINEFMNIDLTSISVPF